MQQKILYYYQEGVKQMFVKIGKWLKKIWAQVHQDPIEAYLAQSTDIVDLEQRMRTLAYTNIRNTKHGEK